MKRYIKNIIPVAALALSMGMTSCTGDLDVTPINPNLSTELDADGLFNKCYANMAMAGNGGANGDCDIDGIDGGTSGFIRQLWNSNELTTDESICHWGDDGIQQFDYNTYDGSHPMLAGLFARLTTGISFCNQYLTVAADIDATKTAEIRFVRSLYYYLLMDAFGNVPFATSLTKPVRYTRQEMYEWLEKELLEIEPDLAAANAKNSSDPMYGRADKAACWILLSRLYLNAEVYTGTAQWAKAAEYAKKVLDSSYDITTTAINGWSAYQTLFMADNGETAAAKEAIFPILGDGMKTTSWGSALFLIAASTDANITIKPGMPSPNGTDQSWGGNRTRPDLLEKFFPGGTAPNVEVYNMTVAANDDRALFDGKDRTLDNADGYASDFSHGFAVGKFNNFRTDGVSASNSQFPDTDFFLFRAAEAYLTYAEATARQNGGIATSEGKQLIDKLRTRAHAATKAAYNLNDILDEWSREFYYEGRRRVDLIRFGKFGGNSDYLWTYKGGTKNGRNFSETRNIFAIPSSQVKGVITQNPGY